MATATYLIALGSNRPLSARLTPRRIVEVAMDALDSPPCRLVRTSPIIETAPMGPARRRFANAAAIIETGLRPPELLRHLKSLERRFGRKGSQRWGDRSVDLDIVMWSNGTWRSPTLTIPHIHAHLRDFVLVPAASIAAGWRHPVTGATLAQHLARIKRPKPVDRKPCRN